MSAIFGLPPLLVRLLAILMVAAVIALVAWALQLMQAATDRQEFSLMLAGCMVCSAAVGLATVMVLTFTGTQSFGAELPPTSLESGLSRPLAGQSSTQPIGTAVPWEVLIRADGSVR